MAIFLAPFNASAQVVYLDDVDTTSDWAITVYDGGSRTIQGAGGKDTISIKRSGAYIGGIAWRYPTSYDATLRFEGIKTLNFDLTAAQADGDFGAFSGTHGTIDAKDTDLIINSSFTNTGNVFSQASVYIVTAGSTNGSGISTETPNFPSNVYATTEVNNLTINSKLNPGSSFIPQLHTGIRAIQGAHNNSGFGPAGRVIVHGDLDMTLDGGRQEAIYVSGQAASDGAKMSTVILNGNATINLNNGTGADNSALKIGKARAQGTGAGYLESHQNLAINMGNTRGAAIKLGVSGSSIIADYDTSSTTIVTNGNAVNIGQEDWGTFASTTGIQARFRDANFTTTSATESLLKVYNNQSDVRFSFIGSGTNLSMQDDQTGWIIDVDQNSVVDMSVSDQAKLVGLVNADDTSTLNLNFDNNTIWDLKERVGAASNATTATFSDLQLNNGSTINAQATDFTLKGNITSDAGIINLSDGGDNLASNFTTLTIDGDYTASNNALLKVDTQLGADNSPTDFLHITGNTSGETGIEVTNRGGLGALTTGDGIQLVQVDGTSQQSNFALKSDYVFEGQAAVVGGAYAYSLYAGNQAGNFAGDWYLRSLFTTPVVPPVTPTEPPVVQPVYQPGVPLYEVYPQVLQQLNKLGTLEQRVGNRTWLTTPTDAQTALINEVEARGFWMKVEGSTGHINTDVSKTNSSYDVDMVKTQIGFDYVARETENGTLIGGLYFQYGHAKADVSSRFGTGDIKTDAYGLGGTMTWYGNNDVYVDGVAQIMWYDSDIRSHWLSQRNLITGNEGVGYAFSIEAGRKIQLNEDWTMTPQAQLSYNAVEFDRFIDAYGAQINRKNGDALTGRLGLAFNREKQWQSEQGDMRRLKTYGIANLYYEFLDGTEVSVTQVNFRNSSDRFWGGLGAGVSYNWKDDAYSIYGEVDARTSFSDFGDSYSLNGTIGFRAKF